MERRTFLKTAVGLVSGAIVAEIHGYSEQSADLIQPSNDFSRTAQTLKQESGLVVGVLSDPIFSGHETPQTLTIEAFRNTWGTKKNVRIVALNKYEIRSFSILFRGHLDVLVYPYGPFYPMDAFPFYTGDTVNGFLKRGGALLTTGGVPFGTPVSDDGRPPKEGTPDPLSLNPDIYSRWVAPFGYKYYVHPYRPPVTGVNRNFLPGVPAQLDLPGAQIGVIVNNSSHRPVPKPYHGNVFPERYPARSITPLFWGEDEYGRVLATNGVLVQDFESGSRRLHLTHHTDPHPLAPNSAFFPSLMDNLFSLLSNRIVVKEVTTDYACYREGEAVTVRAEFASFESSDMEADVVVEVSDESTVVDKHRETVQFPRGKSAFKEWKWSPKTFAHDEYTVVVRVIRNQQSVSQGQNGFVVWKEEVVRRGPKISTGSTYFHKDDGEAFLTGTNYYESTRGEIMWFRPDVSRICADLRQMRNCGVNYIRPHYHHLKWFKDYLGFQHDQLLPYFDSLKTVDSPVPDEHTWRMLDVFIYLCQKHGIIYGGDLFTLVPEEMGDPRGWFPLIEAVVCADKRAAAKRFFQALNERYKSAPCIAWDLWNEPDVPLPLLKQWTDDLRQTLIDSGASRLITVGGGSGEALGNSVDFLGLHVNAKKIRDVVNHSEKPAIAQEVYLDHLEDLTSELLQAEEMREGMLAAVRSGLAGFAPWSWTRQMRLWQDSYEQDPGFRMESWDDRLGAQVHDDGTLKPSGQVFRDIAVVLRSIQLKSFDRRDRSVTTDLGRVTVTLKGVDGATSYSLLHFNGPSCFAAMSLGSVSVNEKIVLAGPEGAYVYALSDRTDIMTTKRLLFKSEMPGILRLFARTSPKSLRLVDTYPGSVKILGELAWSEKGNTIEITTRPTQQAYWILAEW
jgi:hypothetical protein